MNENIPTIDAMLNQITKISHHLPSMEHHAYNVSLLAKEFGQYLGLCHQSIHKLIIGGFLHDIGKVSFTPDLLSSEHHLSQEEIEKIHNHPMVGLVIISPYIIDIQIREIVLFHHERIDGKGYPMQLKGDQIPYFARIISVVDAFDAMTSHRPYQETRTVQQSLDELKKFSGTQFDQEIVQHFIDFINNKKQNRIFLS